MDIIYTKNSDDDEYIKKISKDHTILSAEVPISLIIISEGGTPVFFQSFVENQLFKEHIFGSFVSAINIFIREMFSEGLDRASFGEHTLLMSSISPFFICYIFKGQFYSAQQRIRVFTDKVKNSKEILGIIEKYHKIGQKIQIRDNPALKNLINSLFL